MRLGQSWPKNLKAKMTEPKKLKLLPILRRLNACKKAQNWIRKHKFDTFKETWDNCPDPEWIDWLVGQLSYTLSPNYKEARELSEKANRVWYTQVDDTESLKALAEFYAPHCEKVEQWLFDYAHFNNCAIEVRK